MWCKEGMLVDYFIVNFFLNNFTLLNLFSELLCDIVNLKRLILISKVGTFQCLIPQLRLSQQGTTIMGSLRGINLFEDLHKIRINAGSRDLQHQGSDICTP